MRRSCIFIILALSLAAAGCSKDAEINAFVTELDGVTKDIVSKIESSPNGSGVDAAQKAFDARKADLKTKWDAIKDAVEFQVTAETKKKLEDSVKNNTQSLMDVSLKHGLALAMDEGAMPKFEKLIKDYQAIFTP